MNDTALFTKTIHPDTPCSDLVGQRVLYAPYNDMNYGTVTQTGVVVALKESKAYGLMAQIAPDADQPCQTAHWVTIHAIKAYAWYAVAVQVSDVVEVAIKGVRRVGYVTRVDGTRVYVLFQGDEFRAVHLRRITAVVNRVRRAA